MKTLSVASKIGLPLLWCLLTPPPGLVAQEPPPGRVATHSTRYRQNYRFTHDLFTRCIPVWIKVLEPWKGRANVRYLEVGVYEGGSAIWMLENVLTHPTARMTAVDLFDKEIEEMFRANLQLSGVPEKVELLAGPSAEKLHDLTPESYDLIYIDASHAADDVLVDAVQGWRLLKMGGLIIFDDYLFRGGDPLMTMDYPAELRPFRSIDAFLFAFGDQLEIIHKEYQVIIKKVPSPCVHKWRRHGCSRVGRCAYSWRKRHIEDPVSKQIVDLSRDQSERLETLLKMRQSSWEYDILPDDKLLGRVRDLCIPVRSVP